MVALIVLLSIVVVSGGLALVLGRLGPRAQRVDLPLVWPKVATLTEVEAPRRFATPTIVLLAFCLGFSVAVPGRAWMRLISPEPEFTWSGSIAIAVGFGVLFVGAGLSVAARRQGWRPWPRRVARVISCVLIFPAFGGAGILALPAALFGGLALARSDWRLPLRGAFALVAVAAVGFVAVDIAGDDLSMVRRVLGISLYPVFLWPLVLAARLPLLPRSLAPVATRASTPLEGEG